MKDAGDSSPRGSAPVGRRSRSLWWPVPLACGPLALLVLLPGGGEWVAFLGRFHLAVMHLPIGILFLTALMEGMTMLKPEAFRFPGRLSIFCGALTTVAATTLGLLLANGEHMAGALLESHLRWGIATAALAVLALGIRCLPGYAARRLWPTLYRTALLLTCGTLVWASHQGASITHGERYLTEHLPWRGGAAGQAAATGDEHLVYRRVIAPLFEAKCNACHKAAYNKGGLLMDTYEGLLKGGVSGPGIVPGDVEASLVVARMLLPPGDKKRMPPAKKTQMTQEEIEAVEWWVKQGAPLK